MAIVTVSQTKSNVNVNSTTNTVNVTQGVTNVSVSAFGVTAADIRTALSNTSPITYNTLTGVIGLEQTLDDLTLKKYQETIVDNGSASGIISANITNGTVHTFNLAGDITGITLNNIADGGSASLFFFQDSIGGANLDTTTLPSNFTNWNFTNDFKTFDTSSNAYNIINVFYDAPKYYATLITKTLPAIQNSELANSSLTVNGTTISLGGSGNITTTNIAEGTNLYYTDVRSRGAITVTAPLTYNPGTGLLGITEVGDISEVIAGTGLTGGGSSGAVTLNVVAGLGITANPDNVAVNMSAFSTSDLSEGTNLYYTTARANSAITDYIGSSENAPFAFSGNVDITGNITATGNINYENVVDLNVQDQQITLNANAATDATVSIIANRPAAGANTVLRWNETTDKWQFSNDGSTYIDIAIDTDDLAEGFTNLYFTNARANTVIGTNTTDNLAEGSTNLYYTDSRFDTRLGTKSTSDLSEGTNLYYTDARARLAISATAPLSYNNATGVMSITEVGDISEVIAGNGLTGGGSSGAVTLNAVGGYGITVNADNIEVTNSQIQAQANVAIGNNTTTNLAEGTNLYYTDGRFDTRFGTKTTDNLSEGSTNLYYTDARVNTYINSNNSAEFNQVKVHNLVIKDGPAGNDVYKFGANSASSNQFLVYDGTQFKPTTPSTSIVNEGTNLYYTNARANSAIGNYQGNISTAGTVTAALGSGKIYIGNPSNVSTTVTPSNNFDTSESASVASTVAITLIQAKGNNDGTNSPPGDLVQLTGGQVISDGTLVTINSITNGNATALNGNSYYAFYFDGPGSDDGYALYTNADQTGNVAVVTGYQTSGLGSATYTTTSTVAKFDLANALSNVNSIQSESANDKFTFKALLGADNTPTLSGNITSNGYEVIINSGHTYDSAGNIAQSGSNNLNGYAVSGTFTSGSNAMTITGVTELGNVYNGAASIDGTNNNVSLTGDMVANMIPDNYSGVDGDQYPLPQGTTLVSATASTLTFSQNALANQTFSNASPIAIVHGGKDATTGQIISFVSQADASIVSIASQEDAGLSTVADQDSPVGNETSTTIVVTNVGAGAPTDLAVGTPVTFAGLSGAGSSSINGQTYYIGRQLFGAGMYVLFKSADGTTTPLTTSDVAIVQPTPFDGTGTGGGTYQFNPGALGTSTITKSRLYVEDTYGYPATGPTANDFTYSVGSASDYTIDLSAATTSMRGRTSLEAPRQVLKAPIGLTIGENTTMSNRGDGDALTNFGLNFMWDGLTDYSTQYAGTTSNIVPQMLFKNHTDNTFGAGASGKGKGGPRLFFSAATGNINTNVFDKYPRKSQEIGRMMFWGTTQNGGDAMSTVNPAGYISATASEDWTTSNRLEMSLAANGNGTNDADIFLNYRNGKVVLASGSNGSTNEAIHFAPALQGNAGNAAQTYATLGHTWANVNYANVSASTGSKFTVTQGGAGASTDGDLVISLDREYIAGTLRDVMQTPTDGGFTTFSSSGITGLKTGNETNDTIVMQFADGGIPNIPVGTPVTFENVVGDGNTNLNGGTFYSGRSPDGSGLLTLWTSSDGTTTPAEGATIGLVDANAYSASGTGNGNIVATITGTSSKQWDISLDQGSDDLKIKSGATTQITITNTETKFATTAIPVLPSYSNVSLPGAGTAGGMIFVTNGNNKPAYSNGSAWLYTFDNSAVT